MHVVYAPKGTSQTEAVLCQALYIYIIQTCFPPRGGNKNADAMRDGRREYKENEKITVSG